MSKKSQKYGFTGETKVVDGVTLKRIVAKKNFGRVFKGDVGGWIEKRANLSNGGFCWVSDDAMVYGDAVVSDNASVCYNAIVRGNAMVAENSVVSGFSIVEDMAVIRGFARIRDKAIVCGGSCVKDNAVVSGQAVVKFSGCIKGFEIISGTAVIYKADDYISIVCYWSGMTLVHTFMNGMWCLDNCLFDTKDLLSAAYRNSKEIGDYYKKTVEYVECVRSIKYRKEKMKWWKRLLAVFKA